MAQPPTKMIKGDSDVDVLVGVERNCLSSWESHLPVEDHGRWTVPG
jgi:hypothetical protein